MRTNLTQKEFIGHATAYFGQAGYHIRSRSAADIVFQDGKDINWVLAAFLLVFTVSIGMVIYLIAVGRKQIIFSFFPLNGQIDVLVAGSSPKIQQSALAFLKSFK
jgi:hypothetical protein